MTIQPIEVEARAYVEAYRQADGSLPNYRCDLIEGLLDEIARLRAMMPPSAMPTTLVLNPEK